VRERRAQDEPCHHFFSEDWADDCVWECMVLAAGGRKSVEWSGGDGGEGGGGGGVWRDGGEVK
jgi:hypothetical protein